MLKTYGEDDVTVSTVTLAVALAMVGSASSGALWTLYWILVASTLLETTCCPSYPVPALAILKGVSTSNAAAPAAESKVTVIVVEVVEPSPALILEYQLPYLLNLQSYIHQS